MYGYNTIKPAVLARSASCVQFCAPKAPAHLCNFVFFCICICKGCDVRLCPWGWLVRTTCSTNWSSPRSNSRPGTKHQDPPNTKVQDRLPNTRILYQTPTKHHYIVCRIYRTGIDKNWYLVQAKVAVQFFLYFIYIPCKKISKRCFKKMKKNCASGRCPARWAVRAA